MVQCGGCVQSHKKLVAVRVPPSYLCRRCHRVRCKRRSLSLSALKPTNNVANCGPTYTGGATGCGKSTQCPQFILDEAIAQKRGSSVNIIVSPAPCVLLCLPAAQRGSAPSSLPACALSSVLGAVPVSCVLLLSLRLRHSHHSQPSPPPLPATPPPPHHHHCQSLHHNRTTTAASHSTTTDRTTTTAGHAAKADLSAGSGAARRSGARRAGG